MLVLSLLCCLKERGEGKGSLYVPTVQTCDRTLPVNKTDVRVVATCILSSDELHQIHHTRLVFRLLLEGNAGLIILSSAVPQERDYLILLLFNQIIFI